MKCIKNIKSGEIQRVEDRVAYNMVGLQWSFVAKKEWKTNTRVKTEQQVVEEEKKEKTISKKAEKRIKLKEKQRS